MNKHYINNLLGAFATTISTRIEEEIAELGGRSLTHESALVTIQNHPDETIGALSKTLGITHSGTVRLINTLEQDGLVKRHRHKNDARAVVLRVTTKGILKSQRILEARERAVAQISSELDEKQRETIAAILEKSLSSLTSEQEQARRICRLCNEQSCRPQGCPVELAIRR